MKPQSNFVNIFADYLGSPDRLPFISLPYTVIEPEPVGKAWSDWGSSFYFRTKLRGKRATFGHIEVIPDVIYSPFPFNEGNPSPSSFMIDGISSKRNRNRHHTHKQGFAREFIRRTVLFAYEHGYSEIITSNFIEGGGSFWYNLGFKNIKPIKDLTWPRTHNLAQDVRTWKPQLQNNDPETIWKFAATELGRRVLWDKHNYGIIDFRDNRQCNYAFRRLRLDHLLRKGL